MPPPSMDGSLLTCSVTCSVTKACLTLQPQRLQHTWLLCLSPSPGVCSIESVMPFNHLILCCTLILLTSIFPSIRVFSNEYSELITLGLTGWISLQSNGLSIVFSSITVKKHQFFGTQLSLWYKSHIST